MKQLVKYSGVATVLFVWTTLGTGIARVGPNNLAAFSDLALHTETRALFHISLLISSLLALTFFAYYLERRYELGKYYRLSYLLAFVSQLALIFLPTDPAQNLVYLVHWMFALTLFFATGGIMYSFAVSLNERVPKSIRSKVVTSVILSAFGLSMLTQFFWGTVLVGQSIASLYTHYWIVRTTFLERQP